MTIVIESPKYGEFVVCFDERDYDLIKSYVFHIQKGRRTYYARGFKSNSTPAKFMHTLIMQPENGFVVDHIDGDGLNNRRSNLRVVSPSENAYNQRKALGKSTRFKGVTWRPAKKMYFTCIRKDGKLISGGVHKNILLAAKKYNEMAVIHFGDLAKLNEFTEEEKAEILNPPVESRRINRNNKSGFIGVSKDKKSGKYFATIYLNGKNNHLGTFDDPKMAAIAYNNAMMKYKDFPFTLNNI